MELSEHLFRHESGRLVASLTRIFGIHNLALAEDVVQDAFCRAIDVWKIRGLPDNPSAWLMAVAKRRALDIIRREQTARTYAPDLTRLLQSEWTLALAVDEAFSVPVVRDEQLRMMFSCCHPRLPEEVQIALILNILCGFGAGEIAGAFLTSQAAIEKRISRGKRALAGGKRLFDLSDADVEARLSSVRRALYLLFNEGYHSASGKTTVRVELCGEAMRLAMLLLDAPVSAQPETYALAALMLLLAARVPGRLDESGGLHSLFEQDRSHWDRRLVDDGLALLNRSATGPVASAFHLEAAIAAAHATADSVETTDWSTIVQHYDRLMAIAPSPVVALNRAIAIGQRDGPERGLDALRAIADPDRLRRYPFYPAAFGELERRCGHLAEARAHFASAIALARNAAERGYLERRMQECETSPA